MPVSRRSFLGASAAAAAFAAMPRLAHASCPFRVSVINDEISQDFDHACHVAAHDFGLQWIELRGMWNKNLTSLNAAELAQTRDLLAKYHLHVTDIASPLYKVSWPGAPRSRFSPRTAEFHADFDFKQQDVLLDHCIDLAKMFNTRRIRCFDFWRLDDVAPYRSQMNETLRRAAQKCAKHNLILLLENEMDCNTATGAEAAATLAAIPEPNFMLNWDPGNAATFAGSHPYPDGYNLLPKHRIGHCHAKNVVRKPGGKWQWAPVGTGVVDWTGQLRALMRDGYHYAVSLETHWRGAGTAEASSRISMRDLKAALAKAGAGCFA